MGLDQLGQSKKMIRLGRDIDIGSVYKWLGNVKEEYYIFHLEKNPEGFARERFEWVDFEEGDIILVSDAEEVFEPPSHHYLYTLLIKGKICHITSYYNWCVEKL